MLLLLPDFFPAAIEVSEFENLDINRFQGKASMNSKDRSVIKLANGKGFRISDSSLKETDPLISKSNVKH